jgi:2-oxoglutarate dehydrogenase E2 component (dihydrolipoamide succinyltransferase)
MATEVLMPQMGESIAEGTITRWLVKVGDKVERDQPLFEISTDKVDAEIPAPAAGTLLEIRVSEGETIAVHSVVAVIGEAGEAVLNAGPPPEADAALRPVPSTSASATAAPRTSTGPATIAAPVDGRAERLRTRSSPVVRRIAEVHGIDISRLSGTGVSGRVTRRDIQAFIDRGGATGRRPSGPPAYLPGENVRLEKMSVMRRKIAEHMLLSVRTSPHVYSAFEVDFSRVDELRRLKKAEYEAAGVKLTYTGFIARAAAAAIGACPFANASVDGDTIVYKLDVNIGIAVALDQGLIVPVVRHADRLSMLDLCRAIQDLSSRARSKDLTVDEVQGGTFTITNPGVFGAEFGLPIINQPQVAILGVGSVDKRAVVVGDEVVVRPRCRLTLGHDHRLIDGADGARFLQVMKTTLESFDEALL